MPSLPYVGRGDISHTVHIREMLEVERRDHDTGHWIIEYRENWFGAERRNKAELDTLSPVYRAESFADSTLLIHGKDDTVVRVRQSRLMRDNLKRAGKKVEFVQLKGEDHYLSRPETRLKTLRAIAAFVDEHL